MCTGRYLLALCALAATLASAQPLTGVVQVGAGSGFACALTNAGGVKCWGAGYGSAPVDVPSLPTIQAITVGGQHACALTAGGGVKCWNPPGMGSPQGPQGRLGDGTTNFSATPVDVVGLSSGVVKIDAGGGQTCAIVSTGGLKCWGINIWGEVGNGTYDGWGAPQTTPADVVGLSTGVTEVSAGGQHTCAIANGAVKCWGYSGAGAMGQYFSGVAAVTTPFDVPGLATGAVALAAGSYHSCALMAAGGVKCWGTGYLGDGDENRASLFVDVQGLAPGVVEISAGASVSCARTSTGRLQCWGVNGYGQVGDVSKESKAYPTDVYIPGASQVSAGFDQTCAVIPGGQVGCWGRGAGGGLGNGATTGDWSYPIAVGTFTQQQTVTFPGPLAPRHVGDAPVPLAGTTSSGLPIQFVSTTPSTCTVAGNAVTPTNMGICMVAAIQPGDSSTAAAPAVPHWFLVHGSPTPRLANLSTRMRFAGSRDKDLIAGFVIGGTEPKTVAVRARGPSLAASGVAQPNPDPYLMLHRANGQREDNDNWQIYDVQFMQPIPNADAPRIQELGFAPPDPLEATMIRTLKPGAYTAMIPVRFAGVAILELFELDRPDSPFINISSRGPVTGDEGVLIAGFIIQGDAPQTVVVRARGPTLAQAGVTGVLANPQLQLFSGATQVAFNDDWQQASNAAQVQASGFAPADAAEAAILVTLQPGAYTAIVSGVGGTTGEGIVEVFKN